MSIFDNSLMAELIDYLAEEGINLLITRDLGGNIIVDTQVMAKSHLHLSINEDDQVIAYMRYNEERTITCIDDLLQAAKDCLHNRDFMCGHWVVLLQKEEYLRVETTTTTSFY